MMKLKCALSGQERPTSHNYLATKAARLTASTGAPVTVSELVEKYIAKNVCAELRRGVPASTINPSHGFTDEQLSELVAFNSKSRNTFEFKDGVYTVTGKSEQRRAPRVVAVTPEPPAPEPTAEELSANVETALEALADLND